MIRSLLRCERMSMPSSTTCGGCQGEKNGERGRQNSTLTVDEGSAAPQQRAEWPFRECKGREVAAETRLCRQVPGPTAWSCLVLVYSAGPLLLARLKHAQLGGNPSIQHASAQQLQPEQAFPGVGSLPVSPEGPSSAQNGTPCGGQAGKGARDGIALWRLQASPLLGAQAAGRAQGGWACRTCWLLRRLTCPERHATWPPALPFLACTTPCLPHAPRWPQPQPVYRCHPILKSFKQCTPSRYPRAVVGAQELLGPCVEGVGGVLLEQQEEVPGDAEQALRWVKGRGAWWGGVVVCVWGGESPKQEDHYPDGRDSQTN